MRKSIELIRDLAWVAFVWTPRQVWKRKPLRAIAFGFLAVAVAATMIFVQTPVSPGRAGADTGASIVPPAEPPAPSRVDAAALTASLDSYLALHPDLTSSVRVQIGEEYVDYHPGVHFETASIVKVDVLASLLYLQDEPLSAKQMSAAKKMITQSDNDATNDLFGDIDGPNGLKKANTAFGLTETEASWDWGSVKTTAADQVRLWRAVMYPGVLSEEDVEVVRDLTSSVVRGQTWGMDSLDVPGATVYQKNGWDARENIGGRWLAHSVGMVETDGESDVFVAILTSGHENYDDAMDVVDDIGALVAAAI